MRQQRSIGAQLACVLALALPIAAWGLDADYRFAQSYSIEQLLNDARARDAFAEAYVLREGRFHQDRVGYSELNGMTYDAQRISPVTGEILGMMHWSAAYQEEVHLIMLSMAVAGNVHAARFISFEDPSNAKEKALRILARKIGTLERFHREYPGFGGFLPWFVHSDGGRAMAPAWNYTDHVESEENAGFVWALFLTSHLLEREGETELARRYEAYWRLLAANAVKVFFDPGEGKIRTASRFVEQPDHTFRYEKFVEQHQHEEPPCQPSHHRDWLDTPYFGELMVVFMTLFSPWEDASQPAGVWSDKSVTKTIYRTRDGHEITVRQGLWYSAIEMSSLFYLPYTDVPLIKEVFRLGEVARTMHSVENGIPGLLSMVNIPHGMEIKGAEELYAIGIPSLAASEVVFTNVVAPYAAFAVMIMDEPKGLAWLLSMMKGRKAQGPYGVSEGISTDGRHTAMFLTWYAKGSVMPAFMYDELQRDMRDALRKEGVYDRFIELVSGEYGEAFGSIDDLKGRDLIIAAPSVPMPVPADVSEFEPAGDATPLLRGTPFHGGDALEKNFTRDEYDALRVQPAKGFIFTWITPTDLARRPFIHFRLRTEGKGSFGFELKNRLDMPFNREQEEDRYRGRIMVEVEDTGGEWRTCCIDLRPMMTGQDPIVFTLVLVDPDTAIEFSAEGSVLADRPDPDAWVLVQGDHGFTIPAETGTD